MNLKSLKNINITPFLVPLILATLFTCYRIFETLLNKPHVFVKPLDTLYPMSFLFFADAFFFFLWNIPFFIVFALCEKLKKDPRMIWRGYLFCALNLPIFILCIIDTQSLSVRDRGFELVMLKAFQTELLINILSFVDYWWLLVLAVPAILVVVVLCPKLLKKRIFSRQGFLFLVAIFLLGFTAYKPHLYRMFDLDLYHYKLLSNHLRLNGMAYRLLPILNKRLDSKYKYHCNTRFFDEAATFSSRTQHPDRLSASAEQKKKSDHQHKDHNVIIIVIESFDYKLINQTNTPFLHDLTQKGFYNPTHITNSFSTGASVSSILGSSFDNLYKLSQHHDAPIHTFEKKSYKRFFFFGGPKSVYEFDEVSKKYGLEQISKENYLNETKKTNHIDKGGDVYDGIFLSHVAQKIKQIKTPYFAMVLTNQPHMPFDCPQKDPQVPHGETYLDCLAYVDRSLKTFVQSFENDNTLFVITGDHPTSVDHLGGYFDKYRVPLIFYSKNEDLSQYQADLSTHIDVIPSIIDLLFGDASLSPIHNSLFDDYENRVFVQARLNNSYILAQGDHVIEYSCFSNKFTLLDRSEFKEQHDNQSIENPTLKVHFSNLLKNYIQYSFHGWSEK